MERIMEISHPWMGTPSCKQNFWAKALVYKKCDETLDKPWEDKQ